MGIAFRYNYPLFRRQLYLARGPFHSFHPEETPLALLARFLGRVRTFLSLFSFRFSLGRPSCVHYTHSYAFSRTDNGAPNFFFPLPFLTALFSRLVRFWRPGHDLSRKIRDLSTLTQRVSIFMYNRFVICSLSVPSRMNFIIFRIESRVWVTRNEVDYNIFQSVYRIKMYTRINPWKSQLRRNFNPCVPASVAEKSKEETDIGRASTTGKQSTGLRIERLGWKEVGKKSIIGSKVGPVRPF